MANDPTDFALVTSARAGDAAAFEALVRRHYRTVYAVTLAILKVPMDAEDATQDAFVAALKKLDTCRDASRVGAWFGQVARRRALNLVQYRRVREASPLDDVHVATSGDAATGVEQSDTRRFLTNALNSLSQMQRSVVMLHDLDGRTHPEISEIVGCSPGMSRQHLFSARHLLRRLLGGLRDA